MDFDPLAVFEDDLVEITTDTRSDELAAILALTPRITDDATWAEREAETKAINTAAAAGMVESWGWCFAEKPLNMDANGDIWA